MKQNVNGNRYKNFYKWETVKNVGYDYERNGLLNKIISSRIVNTTNKHLKMMLDFYETSFIFLMKYVDILKNFKNPCWKNR